MATIQSVIDLARLDINDSDKVRYPDADLLRYANDGIAKALTMRPDLNYGNYSNAYADLALTADFPLPLEYRSAVATFITAMAQFGDDPFVVEQRAIQGLKMYLSGLGLGG